MTVGVLSWKAGVRTGDVSYPDPGDLGARRGPGKQRGPREGCGWPSPEPHWVWAPLPPVGNRGGGSDLRQRRRTRQTPQTHRRASRKLPTDRLLGFLSLVYTSSNRGLWVSSPFFTFLSPSSSLLPFPPFPSSPFLSFLLKMHK